MQLSNATVFYNDTLQMMRSPYAIVPSGGGMPPNGIPQVVRRTPHGVVPDAEPGAAWKPPLWKTSKFLPDGRLVRQDALGGFGAASVSPVTVLRTAVIGLGIGLGVATGGIASRDAARGAMVGGVIGLSASILLTLSAALGAAYVTEADNTPK